MTTLQSRKSIGLCMVVNDEVHPIQRCLDSVRPLIDYVLIEYTGSTNATPKLVRQWLAENGIPGEVIWEQWRDFAYNRSHSLAYLRSRKDIDYALILNADNNLEVGSGFDIAAFKASMAADLYDLAVSDGTFCHYRPHLCSNKKEFYFRGLLYEFLESPPDAQSRQRVPGLSIKLLDGGRSQDPQKFEKEAHLLECALKGETDPFLRAHYTFCLAESYSGCGKKEKALENYLARAEMDFSQEEAYVALYKAAQLMEALEYPENEVIAVFQRATDLQPKRVEAMHGASRYCRSKGRNREGADIARGGLDLPLPVDALFVEPWIYETGLLDEFAVNAYWAGDHLGCVQACIRILASDNANQALRKRVESNARFALDRLSEQQKPSPSKASAAPQVPPPPKVFEKRFIRLKEYVSHAKLFHTPSDDYVKARGNALDQKAYMLQTDNQGFIRGTRSPNKATHSIVVLGDSVVESLYLDSDQRFCARLETILREERGIDVIVHNGGYSGATSLHMLNVFLNKIVPMGPDVVILMTGIVDVDVASLKASFWSKDHWVEPLVTPGKNNTWRDGNHLPSCNFSDRRRLLDLFSAAAHSFGIKLWFATVPHQQRGTEDKTTLRNRLDMNETTRSAAHAGGHVLCDLEAQLADRQDIFHDMFHLNQAGGEAVARSFVASGLETALRELQENASGPSVSPQRPGATGDIHVINLDHSTERWKTFRMRNAHLGDFKRVSAVDGKLVDREQLELDRLILPNLDYSPGALGCALSHIQLWQKAALHNRALTVFEDDTTSHPAFLSLRSAVAAELPNDWDIVLWGYLYDPFFLWTEESFASFEIRPYNRMQAFNWNDTINGKSMYRPLKLKHAFGMQSYSISPKGARRCLGGALPLQKRLIPFPGTTIVNEDQGIDGAINLTYPTMQSFICVPPLVVHTDDGVSDRLSKGVT